MFKDSMIPVYVVIGCASGAASSPSVAVGCAFVTVALLVVAIVEIPDRIATYARRRRDRKSWKSTR